MHTITEAPVTRSTISGNMKQTVPFGMVYNLRESGKLMFPIFRRRTDSSRRNGQGRSFAGIVRDGKKLTQE